MVVFDFGNLMLAVYKWVRVTLLTVAAQQEQFKLFSKVVVFVVFETLPLKFSLDITKHKYQQMLAQKIKMLKCKVLFDLNIKK